MTRAVGKDVVNHGTDPFVVCLSHCGKRFRDFNYDLGSVLCSRYFFAIDFVGNMRNLCFDLLQIVQIAAEL